MEGEGEGEGEGEVEEGGLKILMLVFMEASEKEASRKPTRTIVLRFRRASACERGTSK